MKTVYQYWIIRMVFFIILLFCFGNLLIPHYASDSYYVYFDSNNGALQSARIVTYLFLAILDILKINVIKTQSFWSFFSILILTELSYELFIAFEKFLISKNICNYIALGLICLIPFLNIYYLEWFLFPEVVFPYTLGLYCSIKAALCFNHENISIKNYIFSFCLLCVGINTYQVNIAYYIPIALIVVAMNHNFVLSLQAVLASFWIFVIGGTTGLLNIFFQKILGSSMQEREAVFSLAKILENCKIIIDSQKDIWVNGSNLIDHWMIVFLIINFIMVIAIFKGKAPKSKLYVLLLMISSYCSCYVFAIVSQFIWLSPRVLVGISAFLMIISLICVSNIDNVQMNDKLQKSPVKKMITLVYIFSLCFFIIINLIYMSKIIHDHHINNAIDQEYARQIYYEIEQYEKESDNQVRTIYVGTDAEVMWKNTGVSKMTYNVNERAFLNSWSDVSLINFVSGRLFERKEMLPTDYEKNFTPTNWNTFAPKEQIVFKDEAMYWIKY